MREALRVLMHFELKALWFSSDCDDCFEGLSASKEWGFESALRRVGLINKQPYFRYDAAIKEFPRQVITIGIAEVEKQRRRQRIRNNFSIAGTEE